MGVRLKPEVHLKDLKNYGFVTGKDLMKTDERSPESWDKDTYYKVSMSRDDPEKMLYADDDISQPMVRMEIMPDRSIYVECIPSESFEIGGWDLDIVTDTIARLASDGLLEVY